MVTYSGLSNENIAGLGFELNPDLPSLKAQSSGPHWVKRYRAPIQVHLALAP